jgi:nucleotide-binding universal stress UspA family protein
MQTLRNIVVGTDYSPSADHALEAAIALAGLADARITLVHVCALEAPELDDTLLQACREALAETVAHYAAEGVLLTSVVRTGRPADKLNNVATEVGADLIVIGRNGAGRGIREELGSVAERLMRSATRPLLVVPYDRISLLVMEAL